MYRRIKGRNRRNGSEFSLLNPAAETDIFMAKQMLIDATRGEETEMAPWLPYAGVHCASLIQQPADRFLRDPALLAEGVVHAARLYHADGIPLLFDLSLEAESVGCEVAYWGR